MLTRYAALAGVALCMAPGLAAAQTTCDILARNLPQDVLLQGSTAEQFQAQQSIVCGQENSAWGAASGKSLNGSLSVPGYVDAVLGTSSNAQNWSQNFSAFCSLQAGTVAASQAASTTVRRASAVAYNAIVQCVRTFAEQRGIFGEFAVNERRDGFTIKVHHKTEGSSDWEILGVTPTPRPQRFVCNEGFHDASVASPKQIRQASFTIACEKDPDAVIQVAVNTSQGALPTFNVSALNDRLRQIEERLALAESRGVPNEAVAWFALAGCPSGWVDFALARGRTIVGAGNTNNRDARGVVIPNWSVGTVGGEESHQLTAAEMPRHAHPLAEHRNTEEAFGGQAENRRGMEIGGNFHDRILVDGTPETRSTREAGGGNPHNNMPPFVALTPCVKR